MSKHKHRHRSSNINDIRNMNPVNNMNNANNAGGMNNGMPPFPFNLSPQMAEMFKNIDVNALTGLLSTIGSEGFNLNSLSSLLGSSMFNGLGNIMNMGNGMNSGNNANNSLNYDNSANNFSFGREDDANISMLRALRTFVDPSRARFLDKVIELYQSGEFDD